MEWTALLWPVVAVVVLRLCFAKQVIWQELVLPILPALVLIPACKIAGEATMTKDSERHGGWVVRIEDHERWNEWVHKTCSYTTGSGKNKQTHYRDCSYVRNHPQYWVSIDSNGHETQISHSQYQELVRRFKKPQSFKDMHRHYHTIDGDIYYVDAPIDWPLMKPVVTEHSYENRVKVSLSTFNYKRITHADARHEGLFEYPEVSYLDDPIVLGSPIDQLAHDKWKYVNARHGRKHEIRLWVLLFKNKPRSIAFDQESYWQGGNKNEFVICLGLDGENVVDWMECFSWSPDGYAGNDLMALELQDRFEEKPLDLLALADDINKKIDQHWKRKSFKEFAYIRVYLPWWMHLIVHVITIMSTVAVCAWAVANEHGETDSEHNHNRYRRPSLLR